MNARVDTSVLSHLSNRHLDALEEETIFILREVAAAFERPTLLFSGGKDSLVMLRCAEKAFGAGRIPYPLLMIDTGHNFPEVTDFRDQRARELGAELIVRSVEDSMARGTVRLAHPGESRNVHQSVTLLEAIDEFRFDALIGGARRDEEKARAKERIFSHRDSFGQWQPKAQRPELWTLFNTRIAQESISASSPSATGPSWTCGSTSPEKTSPCHRSTTPTSAMWWSARACWCP